MDATSPSAASEARWTSDSIRGRFSFKAATTLVEDWLTASPWSHDADPNCRPAHGSGSLP